MKRAKGSELSSQELTSGNEIEPELNSNSLLEPSSSSLASIRQSLFEKYQESIDLGKTYEAQHYVESMQKINDMLNRNEDLKFQRSYNFQKLEMEKMLELAKVQAKRENDRELRVVDLTNANSLVDDRMNQTQIELAKMQASAAKNFREWMMGALCIFLSIGLGFTGSAFAVPLFWGGVTLITGKAIQEAVTGSRK